MNRVQIAKRLVMVAVCSQLIAGCAMLGRHPGAGTGQGEPIVIGVIGEKRHLIKGLMVRTSTPVCDVNAYVASFRNGLVNRWDTNAMLDRLPKRWYLDVPPEDLRRFFSSGSSEQCVLESIATGEADGDRVGKKMYGELLQKLTAPTH
jgi:hypothetical protein